MVAPENMPYDNHLGIAAMSRKPGGEAAIRARIWAAPGVSEDEGHRLAGLLEAECHLYVVPNNRTESKVECAALVDLLDQHQLRGRKRSEYAVWREAVRLWATRRYGVTPEDRLRLRGLARALKENRVYREPPAEAELPDLGDSHALQYFAGFFSGEGCFILGPRNARFVVKLRRDDRPLLAAFQSQFQLGSVRDVAIPEPWSPAAVWHVTSARDVLRGIALFESAGLIGRKRRQFLAWRPGAEAVAHAKIERKPVDARVVTEAWRALKRATAYTPPAEPLAPDRRYVDTRTAYIDILRAWAASFDGALSCLEYQTARELHRHWPKRETIAFAFGGWYQALEAAGLEGRAARQYSAR
jgi:hypothetical protein